MIRAPHMPAAAGKQTPQLAEALDLYRTLAALLLVSRLSRISDRTWGRRN
jgi:arylsulfatase A-like enzyme